MEDQYSAFSNELIFAFGPFPTSPTGLTKVDSNSNRTAIGLKWNKVTGDTLPILGYRIYADSGLYDTFSMIYDGNNMPEIFQYIYTSTKLNSFLSYRFYVTSINFNGES